MKIKKLLSVCLAGILAASFALTGCTDKNEKAATDNNVTLKMLVPGYDGGYLKKELDP